LPVGFHVRRFIAARSASVCRNETEFVGYLSATRMSDASRRPNGNQSDSGAFRACYLPRILEAAMPLDGTLYDSQILALDKLDQVIDLLATPDRWCKGTLRSPNGRRCLVGAMLAVDAVTALRRPVLDAIHEVSGGHYRRIEKFNDARSTTHSLVIAVLMRTRQNLIRGFGEQLSVAAPIRRGFWGSLRSFSI
jgi:hypothetical protein